MEEEKRGHMKGEMRDPRVISTITTIFPVLAMAMTELIVMKGQTLTTLPNAVINSNLLATLNLLFLIQK